LPNKNSGYESVTCRLLVFPRFQQGSLLHARSQLVDRDTMNEFHTLLGINKKL